MRKLIAALSAFVARLFTSRPKALPPADEAVTGPPSDEHEIVYVGDVSRANWGEAREPLPVVPVWELGWYTQAERVPAHPGRVGPVIKPRTVVVHTTDMHPSQHDALVRGWKDRKGAGNCAHFLIGRTPEQGIKQFCQITRNGNHAGGSNGHGWYRTPEGRLVHPNTVAVGIELDCAGHLKKRGTEWIHPDTGLIIPDSEVFVVGNKGFHKVTRYQFDALERLLQALGQSLVPMAAGTRIVSNGTYKDNGVPWAARPDAHVVVGHVTLDPRNKTDPGPQVMAWLREENFA